jgi:hypothetical protein
MFKKLIGPVVVGLCVGVYYILVARFLFSAQLPRGIKITAGVLPVAVIGVSVYVLVDRINEIRSGEEDDLGQY